MQRLEGGGGHLMWGELRGQCDLEEKKGLTLPASASLKVWGQEREQKPGAEGAWPADLVGMLGRKKGVSGGDGKN